MTVFWLGHDKTFPVVPGIAPAQSLFVMAPGSNRCIAPLSGPLVVLKFLYLECKTFIETVVFLSEEISKIHLYVFRHIELLNEVLAQF